MSKTFAPLARAFVRVGAVRWSAAIVGGVLSAIVALTMIAQGFQQSSDQLAAAANGRFDYALAWPGEEELGEPGNAPAGKDIARAMVAAGADEALVGFVAYQIPLDEKPGTWTNLIELDWPADPFPSRFTVLEGRLPEQPGEVAVSSVLRESIPGDNLSLADARLSLRVVGVIEDSTGRDAPLGLLSPGTWRSATGGDSLQGLSGAQAFFWNSNDGPATVTSAIGSVFLAASVEMPAMAQTEQAVSSRREIIAQEPTLYSELGVLLIVLPAVAGYISGWAGARFVRRSRDTLMQIGITETRTPAAVAIVGTSALAAALGIIVGIGAGFVGRAILDGTHYREIGPIYGLTALIPISIGLLIVGLVLGMATVRPARKGNRVVHEGPRYGPLLQFSPAVSAAFVFAGVFVGQSADLNVRLLSPFLVGLAVVCLIPFALLLVQQINAKTPSVHLALQRLRADRKGASFVAFGLGSIMLLSFSTLVINYSAVASDNARIFAQVPPGQVQFAPITQDDTSGLREAIESYVGVAHPILLSMASAATELNSGPIGIVDSPDDLERLLGATLSDDVRAQMLAGGVVRHFDISATTETLRLDDGSTIPIAVAPLPEAVDAYQQYAGFITSAVASELDLTIVNPTWVYVGLTGEQSSLFAEAAVRLEVPADWLRVHEAPNLRTEPPVIMLIALIAGVLGAVLIAYYASAMTRSLRPTLAALRAIGISSRWLRIVLVVQVGVVAVTATFVAFVAAAIATYVSTITWLTTAQLYIPWGSIGLLVAVVILGALLALVLAGRKLSVAERVM